MASLARGGLMRHCARRRKSGGLWGEDRKSWSPRGAGARPGFRALFDGSPIGGRPMGAAGRRREDRRLHVRLRQFRRSARLPAPGLDVPDRYTLLEALPPMRGSHAFDAYVRVLRGRRAVVPGGHLQHAVRRGLHVWGFVQRTVKLGDGLINFLTDSVTAQRRLEAELRSFAEAGVQITHRSRASRSMLRAPRRGPPSRRRSCASSG